LALALAAVRLFAVALLTPPLVYVAMTTTSTYESHFGGSA
jgi:hypothetical protein